MTLQTDRPWNTTAFWSEPAEQSFTAMRRKARRQVWRDRLHGRRSTLVPFDEAAGRLGLLPGSDVHAATVRLDLIIGSVAKDGLFTRGFYPATTRILGRWKRAYARAHHLAGYDPVELYEVAGRYFVVDGHFRVSVARALGSDTIEATVRRWA